MDTFLCRVWSGRRAWEGRVSGLPAQKRTGVLGTSEAQHRPSLASCSFSKLTRGLCRMQAQSSSRPACQEYRRN